MRFLETAVERQLRVRALWTNLYKTKAMTALQVEAEGESGTAQMEEVGLALSPLEKFLSYLTKVGPSNAEVLRMDRRPRPDKAGGVTTRVAEAWEELHEVLCELEGVKAGTRAFGYVGRGGPQAFNAGAFGTGEGKGKGSSETEGEGGCPLPGAHTGGEGPRGGGDGHCCQA